MSLSRIGTLSFEQRSNGRWRFIAHKTETLKGLLHVSLHRELTEEGPEREGNGESWRALLARVGMQDKTSLQIWYSRARSLVFSRRVMCSKVLPPSPHGRKIRCRVIHVEMMGEVAGELAPVARPVLHAGRHAVHL